MCDWDLGGLDEPVREVEARQREQGLREGEAPAAQFDLVFASQARRGCWHSWLLEGHHLIMRAH